MPEATPRGVARSAGRPASRIGSTRGETRSFDRLRRTVEGDLLPRLLLVHNAGPIPPRLAARAADLLPQAEFQRLMEMLLGSAPDQDLAGLLEGLLSDGHSADAVFVDLLAPAARRLGTLWEEDDCNFVEVGLACSRLQRSVRRISSQLGALSPLNSKGTVLVMGLPGEEHTLGPVLVAELLYQDGWSVVLGEPFAPLGDYAGIDIVAFSLARTDHWRQARRAIARVRASGPERLQVMVGGAAFLKEPALVYRVGGDGWAEDGRSAKELANRLMAQQRAIWS